ncbi:DUF881 domain-containing protein [uncultured Tessaracoccus sp.]|uniref:DUF881 domain-containing protein n=1 Tax=uncultured Tessaracoccus sp. TaxID=905023 RepID=UPI002607E64B|nr:DUF881 domain-containing protein [uncultured Tessaracoccus sp.]
MSLLRTLTEGALEPEYQSTPAPRRRPVVSFITVALIVSLLTYALVQTFTSRDVRAAERSALLAEVTDAQQHHNALEQRTRQLEDDIRELQLTHLDDPQARAQLAQVELISGAVAVEGPGVVVTVDDAPNATGTQGRVLDSDLSQLVSGLFEAGAEAVAVNGRRITSRTPIRSAGAAVTVDYVSLSPPYRVEAIGDPSQLPARFAATRASNWWQYLVMNYGLTLDFTQSDGDLRLPADPGLGVTLAKGD